ncbi:hypothetical protein [Photobacterium kagoshimensis]|uniref:hypothetical protein n=1 Tax=Photobacterium kagoshimensis TaxID=2910242 RepID=UPI003D0D497F
MKNFHLNLELQHIYLEVNAERFHYLPLFFESYYCHRHGIVTNNDKVDWEGIFKVAPRSLLAQRVTDRKQLVREWFLPSAVLIGQLKAMVRDEQLSLTALQTALDQKLFYVVITREEQAKLKQQGRLKSMPASYYQTSHKDYGNPFTRFLNADIHLGDECKISQQ